jgi:hypothetical protein
MTIVAIQDASTHRLRSILFYIYVINVNVSDNSLTGFTQTGTKWLLKQKPRIRLNPGVGYGT